MQPESSRRSLFVVLLIVLLAGGVISTAIVGVAVYAHWSYTAALRSTIDAPEPARTTP